MGNNIFAIMVATLVAGYYAAGLQRSQSIEDIHNQAIKETQELLRKVALKDHK